jgi:hypothetical protein
MILGALVDAGLAFEDLVAGLEALGLGGYRLERREVMKGPFRATKVDVHVDRGAGAHPHRNLAAILELLGGSRLPEPVRHDAARVFRRLAEAEARVHGTTPEQVHFHDVGAVDAIVDVTGACLGLHRLGVEAVHCSALPVGGGTVGGPHGRIPVPAPGTVELLRGFPVRDTGVARELTTPTGAAILTTLARGAGRMPAMTLTRVGYGAGTLDLETPNVLRLLVGEAAAPAGTETVLAVETTIDDMSPQLYEPLIERLLEAGALDVHLTPVIMKRSRPGVVLTALGPPERLEALTRTLFEESTTIGVRWAAYERRPLPRETLPVETGYGPVHVKVSRLDGRIVTATPEFEEVRRLARASGRPVRVVLEAARAAARRLVD